MDLIDFPYYWYKFVEAQTETEDSKPSVKDEIKYINKLLDILGEYCKQEELELQYHKGRNDMWGIFEILKCEEHDKKQQFVYDIFGFLKEKLYLAQQRDKA